MIRFGSSSLLYVIFPEGLTSPPRPGPQTHTLKSCWKPPLLLRLGPHPPEGLLQSWPSQNLPSSSCQYMVDTVLSWSHIRFYRQNSEEGSNQKFSDSFMLLSAYWTPGWPRQGRNDIHLHRHHKMHCEARRRTWITKFHQLHPAAEQTVSKLTLSWPGNSRARSCHHIRDVLQMDFADTGAGQS